MENIKKKIGSYVRDKEGNPLVNVVWPGFTIFPDFSHPNTSDFWLEMIQNFHSSQGGLYGAEFDGLWIGILFEFKLKKKFFHLKIFFEI